MNPMHQDKEKESLLGYAEAYKYPRARIHVDDWMDWLMTRPAPRGTQQGRRVPAAMPRRASSDDLFNAVQF